MIGQELPLIFFIIKSNSQILLFSDEIHKINNQNSIHLKLALESFSSVTGEKYQGYNRARDMHTAKEKKSRCGVITHRRNWEKCDCSRSASSTACLTPITWHHGVELVQSGITSEFVGVWRGCRFHHPFRELLRRWVLVIIGRGVWVPRHSILHYRNQVR